MEAIAKFRKVRSINRQNVYCKWTVLMHSGSWLVKKCNVLQSSIIILLSLKQYQVAFVIVFKTRRYQLDVSKLISCLRFVVVLISVIISFNIFLFILYHFLYV